MVAGGHSEEANLHLRFMRVGPLHAAGVPHFPNQGSSPSRRFAIPPAGPKPNQFRSANPPAKTSFIPRREKGYPYGS